MEKRKIKLKIGKKSFEIELSVVPWYLEGIGLMFSRRERADALLFNLKKPVKMSIHSFFVPYEFIAIWLDVSGEILEMRKVLPWKSGVLPSEKFIKLIEIPCNQKYSEICKSLVEDKKFKY